MVAIVALQNVDVVQIICPAKVFHVDAVKIQKGTCCPKLPLLVKEKTAQLFPAFPLNQCVQVLWFDTDFLGKTMKKCVHALPFRF